MIHPTATTRDASDTLLGCLMTSSLVGRPRRHARGAQALASRRPAMSDRPSRGSTARHAITCGHAVENRRPAAMVKETANMRQSSLQACSAAGRHTAARRRADDGRHLKGHRRPKCSYRAAVRAPAFSAIKTTRKSSYLMSGRCTLVPRGLTVETINFRNQVELETRARHRARVRPPTRRSLRWDIGHSLLDACLQEPAGRARR